MDIADILSTRKMACKAAPTSKKKALEMVSELLATDEQTLTQKQIFECLISREKLGSTGLSHGVAIPHGRMKNADHTLAAFLQLEHGIDYDAMDQQPVDLIFALLVPEESTEEHIQILAALAEMFSDESLRQRLRNAQDNEELHQILRQWHA